MGKIYGFDYLHIFLSTWVPGMEPLRIKRFNCIARKKEPKIPYRRVKPGVSIPAPEVKILVGFWEESKEL